jgi:hypothetical protein
MALLLRPSIKVGEGAKGFLKRLAQENELDLTELSNLGVQFDVQMLMGMEYLPADFLNSDAGRYAKKLEKTLVENPHAWNREVPRYCPICLGRDQFWHFEWEVLCIDACPEHGIWLIDKCGECHQSLNWKRHQLMRCACGANLVTQQHAECPKAVISLSHAVMQSTINTIDKNPLPIVTSLSLKQIQRLVRYLGIYGDPMVGLKPKRPAVGNRLSKSWLITSLAAEILDQWPKSFHGLLDCMQKRQAGTSAGRFVGRFGNFYPMLYRAFPELEFEFMRSEFETYVAENWRGSFGKRNRRLFERINKRMAWIPSQHACKSMGISSRRIRDLIADNQIRGEERIGNSGRKFLVVSRPDVEEHTKKISTEIDMSAAATLLGLKRIRAASILPRLIQDAYKTGGAGCPWAIPRAAVDELINVGQEKPKKTSIEQEEISLGYLLRYWPWSDDAIAQLLSASLEGKLNPVARLESQSGISGWVYSQPKLREWYKNLNQQPTQSLSVPEVATRLSIKQEVAYFLVRNSMIKADVVQRERIAESRVKPEELEIFETNYAFGRDLAATAETSSRGLAGHLRKLGINPICGPGVNECRQLIYAKDSELENAMNLLTKNSKRLAVNV